MNYKNNLLIHVSLLTLVLTLTACGGSDTLVGDSDTTVEGTAGSTDVKVDGSSTVFPISEAMAEEFKNGNKEVEITIGVSGSGGGFKKLCAGETDISNASRPIKKSEIDLCAENGIEYVEVPVAFDGISVVVNKGNDWATCLKAEDLGKMWGVAAEGKVQNWSTVGDFPEKDLRLYGPGTDSGTFDYFVEATIGKKGESRGDYTASEDDNVIVQGVTTDEGGLGYFGYAYYEENKDKLKAVAIENSDGKCVEPSETTIADGSYNPLSRPIFFYVKKSSLSENEAVKAFVEYQIDPANSKLISEVGYVPLPSEIQAKVKERLDNGTTGSIFEGGSSVGVKLADKL